MERLYLAIKWISMLQTSYLCVIKMIAPIECLLLDYEQLFSQRL